MNVKIKSGMQSEAIRKLSTYLDGHPEEARSLCESAFIDLMRHLTITQTEEWLRLLDDAIVNDISWSTETEEE